MINRRLVAEFNNFLHGQMLSCARHFAYAKRGTIALGLRAPQNDAEFLQACLEAVIRRINNEHRPYKCRLRTGFAVNESTNTARGGIIREFPVSIEIPGTDNKSTKITMNIRGVVFNNSGDRNAGILFTSREHLPDLFHLRPITTMACRDHTAAEIAHTLDEWHRVNWKASSQLQRKRPSNLIIFPA